MFKFLRKYNKWILVVGGTLLMITFLMPQAIQTLSQRAAEGSAVVATVGPKKQTISPIEWNDVQQETELLEQVKNIVTGTSLVMGANIEQPEHWYLLQREAQEAGLVAFRPAEIDNPTLQFYGNLIGRTMDFAGQTFAKTDGVNRLIGLYLSAGELSDARLRNFAEKLLHEVSVQMAVIRGSADDDMDYEPTEEELQAQFEQFADVSPTTTDGKTTYGYKIPNRFKIEWIEVPADGIREQIRGSDEMNAIELRRHWRSNAGLRGIPEVDPQAEVPDVVIEDRIDELSREKLDRIAKFAKDQLRMRQSGLAEEESWRALPEDWDQQRLAFPKLAEMIRDRFDIELPAYKSTGSDWLEVTSKNINELGDIATARTDTFGQSLGLFPLINGCKEFGASPNAPIQTGIAGPPLRSADDHSVFVFRLTETDPSHAPESLDEVRDQVVADLKAKRSFERLVERSDALVAEAVENGLVSLCLEHDGEFQPQQKVSRGDYNALRTQRALREALGQQQIPTLGGTRLSVGDKDTIVAIVDHAMGIGKDVDLSTLPEDQRYFAVPVEGENALLIVRLMNQKPTSQEAYEFLAEDGTLQTLLRQEELSEGAQGLESFGLDEIVKRSKFSFTRGNSTDADETDEDDKAATQGDLKTAQADG